MSHIVFDYNNKKHVFSGSLEKYVKILDDKFKTATLKAVYAGVNGKTVDDPDMQAFFKMKCWI